MRRLSDVASHLSLHCIETRSNSSNAEQDSYCPWVSICSCNSTSPSYTDYHVKKRQPNWLKTARRNRGCKSQQPQGRVIAQTSKSTSFLALLDVYIQLLYQFNCQFNKTHKINMIKKILLAKQPAVKRQWLFLSMKQIQDPSIQVSKDKEISPVLFFGFEGFFLFWFGFFNFGAFEGLVDWVLLFIFLKCKNKQYNSDS